MKISLTWLRRYIPLDKTAEELAEALPLIGFEVEEVIHTGLPPLENVVVGEVLEREQHPNADRLSVCQVKVDTAADPKTIVCGAKNFQVGDRVPVALPGAILPGDFKITRSKLRGVESDGMMCSAKELGLGEDHAGLLILEQRPEIGAGINEVFPEGDAVLDIEITANRPDTLNHMGIARELSALYGLTLKYPETRVSPGSPFEERHPSLLQDVVVEETEFCPHYRAYSIRGVKVGPSPDWLRQSIEAVGLRSINNVVDVTNYVLFELGHPMHAFDAAKIGGEKIVVRNAREGEKLITLDEVERILEPWMTVIADAEKPMVVAGIMGGEDSGVTEATTDVVLEVAYFDPVRVRRTARHLGLSSDSSYRYERGIDPTGAEYTALRALDLILEVAGGEVVGPPQVAGGASPIRQEISITPKYIADRCGYDAPTEEIVRVFESLDLAVTRGDEDGPEETLTVAVPGFRVDLERPIDLVEEFVRIHGTDKIPEVPVTGPALLAEDDGVARFRRDAAAYMTGQHFAECYHYSMRDAEELQRWFAEEAVAPLALANPLASDQGTLRPSLIPGLLDALRLNRSRYNQPERLFEIGQVWRVHEGSVYELLSVGLIWVQGPLPSTWAERSEPAFRDTRILIDNLARLAGLPVGQIVPERIEDSALWQPERAGRAGDFTQSAEVQGGLLALPMLKAWDIEGTVLAGEIAILPSLLDTPRPIPAYVPFGNFPPSRRDLALLVDAGLPAEAVRADLLAFAREASGDAFAVESVEVFDVYVGTGLPEGKKSLAFGFSFRSSERTLKDKEVNRAFDQIQEKIASETAYAVRT